MQAWMPRRLSATNRRDQRAASINTSVALTNALEDVVHERVEDEHRLVRDSRVGVDLLEDLVDVGRANGAGRHWSALSTWPARQGTTHYVSLRVLRFFFFSPSAAGVFLTAFLAGALPAGFLPGALDAVDVDAGFFSETVDLGAMVMRCGSVG